LPFRPRVCVSLRLGAVLVKLIPPQFRHGLFRFSGIGSKGFLIPGRLDSCCAICIWLFFPGFGSVGFGRYLVPCVPVDAVCRLRFWLGEVTARLRVAPSAVWLPCRLLLPRLIVLGPRAL